MSRLWTPRPNRRPMSMSRRGLLAGSAAAALGVPLTGCGKGADTVLLRMGHVNSADDPWQATSEEFAELVNERSGGEIEIDVFPGGQLGDDVDMIEGMRIGSVDLALVAGVLSSVEPSITMLELPYLFDSVGSLEKALQGPGGEQLSASLLDAGIRNLAWLHRGPRELTANRPIRTPDEVDDAKLRVPEIPASLDAWRAMGANPTPMSFSEVYGALQQGVIDGQENPLAVIESGNLAEVQSHLMLTDHVYGYVMLALSERAWDDLSERHQQVLTSAAVEVRQRHNERTAAEEKEYRSSLSDAGMEFIQVDKEAFARATMPVTERYADEFGRDLYEKLVAFNG